MPLSENEQRILSEIEEQFYRSDPLLAREVATTTVLSHPLRNLKGATALFIGGIAVMVLGLSVSYLVSFAGYLIMLSSAFWFERNARMVGSFGMQQVAESFRTGSVRPGRRSPEDDA